MELKGEKYGKDEKHIRKLLRKNPQRVSINSRRKGHLDRRSKESILQAKDSRY